MTTTERIPRRIHSLRIHSLDELRALSGCDGLNGVSPEGRRRSPKPRCSRACPHQSGHDRRDRSQAQEAGLAPQRGGRPGRTHGGIPAGTERQVHAVLTVLRGTGRADTPLSHLRPPEPRDSKGLLFKPPGGWCLVTAVLLRAPDSSLLEVGLFTEATEQHESSH